MRRRSCRRIRNFALQHRVAPPRKAYSLTSSAFIEFGALYPFFLFKPVFRGSLTSYSSVLGCDSGTSWKLPWTTASASASASASAMQSARSSAGSGSVKSFAHMSLSRANVLLASARGSHVFHGAFQPEILRNRRADCRGAVV